MTYPLRKGRDASCCTSQLLAVLLIFSACAPAAAADVLPTLSSIQDELLRQELAIKSLEVTYTYRSSLLGRPEDAHAYLGTMHLVDETHTYAIKGEKRLYDAQRTDDSADLFASVKPIVPLGNATVSRLSRIPANIVNAFDGEVLRRRDSGGVSAAIINGTVADTDGRYFQPKYLGLMCRLPADVFGGEVRQTLAQAIAAGACTLRAGTEGVSGVDCVVIDWHGDLNKTVWCDPALGFAVRQKKLFYSNGRDIMWHTTILEFFEPIEGVSFPRRVISDRSAGPDASVAIRNVGLVRYAFDVKHLSVNNVPDERFELRIPPGIPVGDFIHGHTNERNGKRVAKVVYATPEGGFVEPSPVLREEPTRRNRALRITIITANIVLVVALLVLLARRSARRR